LKKPFSLNAWIAYSEHVGVKRHRPPRNGESVRRYSQTAPTADLAKTLEKLLKSLRKLFIEVSMLHILKDVFLEPLVSNKNVEVGGFRKSG
jgi:hypothetical protein